jgi:hypothetical protein
MGVHARASLNADNATVTGAAGVRARIVTGQAGSNRVFTNAYGMFADTYLYAGGSMTAFYGLYVYPNAGSGSISTAYGVYASFATGTVSTTYGLYVAGGGSATTRWGVYVADASARNYFAGNVGLNQTNPAVALDVDGEIHVTHDVHLGVKSTTLGIPGTPALCPIAVKRALASGSAMGDGFGPGLAFLWESDQIAEYAAAALYYLTVNAGSPDYQTGYFSFVVHPTDAGPSPVRTEIVRLSHAGAVQATAAASPVFSFLSDTTTGVGYPTSSALGFYLGSAEKYRMDATALYPLPAETLDLGKSGNAFNHLWSVYAHVGRVSSLPTASAAYEGALVRRAGQGTPPGADTLHVCISVHPSGPTTYAWRQVTLT